MALHATRRQFLAGVGVAATAGTALLSPGRPAGSPELSPAIPTGTWPAAGRDPARTKHVPEAPPVGTEVRVAWSASTPLSPWNPTVVVDGTTVYVARSDGVTARDSSDGTVRWRFDVTDHWPSGIEINVGPILAGDRVLLVTVASVIALDAATGDIRWAREVRTDRRQAVLVGDALYLPNRSEGAGFVGIDVATGGRWFRFDTERYWSPVAFVNGELIAISDTLASFNPRTGERRWTAENPGSSELPNTAFAGGDRVVVVGSNPLVVVDQGDGTEVWRYEAQTGENEIETFRPATDGERVYVSAYWAEETIAFDAATGDVVWRIPERLGEPVVAGDTVYCVDGSGITVLDAATGDRRGQVGADLLPSEAAPKVAVTGDRLYVAYAPDVTTRPTLFALEAP